MKKIKRIIIIEEEGDNGILGSTFYPKKGSVCDNCSNNPKNGGSGVCLCTLPYANGEGPIWTC